MPIFKRNGPAGDWQCERPALNKIANSSIMLLLQWQDMIQIAELDERHTECQIFKGFHLCLQVDQEPEKRVQSIQGLVIQAGSYQFTLDNGTPTTVQGSSVQAVCKYY